MRQDRSKQRRREREGRRQTDRQTGEHSTAQSTAQSTEHSAPHEFPQVRVLGELQTAVHHAPGVVALVATQTQHVRRQHLLSRGSPALPLLLPLPLPLPLSAIRVRAVLLLAALLLHRRQAVLQRLHEEGEQHHVGLQHVLELSRIGLQHAALVQAVQQAKQGLRRVHVRAADDQLVVLLHLQELSQSLRVVGGLDQLQLSCESKTSN
jgi:hypothetical protein